MKLKLRMKMCIGLMAMLMVGCAGQKALIPEATSLESVSAIEAEPIVIKIDTEKTLVQETSAPSQELPVSVRETSAPTGPGVIKREQSFAAKLKAAEGLEQLIVVVGGGAGSDKVTVSYHEKDNEGLWQEVFTTSGVYGKNGGTADKREGDSRTPLGLYQFTMSFGLLENPGSVIPYHKIQSGDYWVDDSNSTYYNQLVNINTTKKAWKSAENMATSAPYYNYALALNYNPDCVPGKGSAIFLHCTKSEADTGSAGCIRIPEALVKKLIQSVKAEAKILIVEDQTGLEYQ